MFSAGIVVEVEPRTRPKQISYLPYSPGSPSIETTRRCQRILYRYNLLGIQ